LVKSVSRGKTLPFLKFLFGKFCCKRLPLNKYPDIRSTEPHMLGVCYKCNYQFFCIQSALFGLKFSNTTLCFTVSPIRFGEVDLLLLVLMGVCCLLNFSATPSSFRAMVPRPFCVRLLFGSANNCLFLLLFF